MERFYAEPENIAAGKVSFSAEQMKYIRKVLRLEEGAKVAVTDGRGQVYLCRLRFLSREKLEGEILSPLREDREPRLRVALYQGIPKGDKMDQVVRQSVELGAWKIVPLQSHRCVVRLEGRKPEERQQRWQKIAASALEQSGRNCLPPVTGPLPLSRALQEIPKGALALMPWEGETSLGLTDLLQGHPQPKEAHLFIGPEGGFSPREAEEAAAAGVTRVTLGPRILRTETAGPAALAVILSHYGDLGGRREP